MTDIDERVQRLVSEVAARGAGAPWRATAEEVRRSVSGGRRRVLRPIVRLAPHVILRRAAVVVVVLLVVVGGLFAARTVTRTNGPVLPATKSVSAGGFAIEVPSNWSLPTPRKCLEVTSSAVVVGSFLGLGEGFCLPLSPKGTVVLFGRGGPPFPPIPAVYEGQESFHGVSVQVMIGADTGFGTSYLLALLPGRTSWLLMAAPGAAPTTALVEARRILSTVHFARGSSAGPPPHPIRESFIGAWHVHDANLVISSDTAGAISGRSGLVCHCVETDTLSLSLSSDGTQMRAVVSKITTMNVVTGKVVINPHPNEVLGQASFFEFMEPHLILQVSLPTEPPDLSYSFGNAYFCSNGLNPRFGGACGA